ncbi:hypothetical protein H6783_01610 [Candidatus Nomurabacteria bacterium]|nr:hypothetical protein [Candidatus Nomurabacteria bacterium]
MDVTALSVVAFATVKIILWLTLIIIAIGVARKVIIDNKAASAEAAENGVQDDTWHLSNALWGNRLRIGVVVAVALVVTMLSQIELAYRPKTSVNINNPVLQEQLRAIDQAERPDIKPALGDKRDNANADYSARNRAENEAARDSFQQLPSSN